ncbi:MAG: cytochrome c biogenesis protein CcdA [Flavobacteriaceae bacterium]
MKPIYLLLLVAQSLWAQNTVQWSAQARQTDSQTYDVVLSATIAENWKLYGTDLPEGGPLPTVLKWENTSPVGAIQGTTPKTGFDPIFQMELSYFTEGAMLVQAVENSADDIQLTIEYQACDDAICIFREENLVIPTDGTLVNAIDRDLTDIEVEGDSLVLDLKNTALLEASVATKNSSWWGIFVLGLLGGFLALLTPCVFPLIPLTVSYFSKSSTSRSEGIRRSLAYTFSIIGIYVLLSLPFHFLDQLRPEVLNSIATNVVLNMVFFVVFLLFALSFFGLFDITLPASWTSKSDEASAKSNYLGIFFMALTLALVSFSCTGPILGSLLVGSLTADGGAMQLTAGMLGFGTALAFPFGFLSFFPNVLNKLPKSGGWLHNVKVSLGFIELALALKFLSNADMVQNWGLIPRELFIGIWMLILLLWAVFLLGGLSFLHAKPKMGNSLQKVLGIAVLVFVGYLAQGILPNQNVPLRALSGFPPPTFYSVYQTDSDCPLGLDCYKDFESGKAAANAQQKPILLDFTGWACVNCRKVEENIWTKPEIFELLSNEVVLISLYVDDRKPLTEEDQQTITYADGSSRTLKTVGQKWSAFQALNFKSVSQPYYVLMLPDGTLLNPPIQYTDANTYLAWLKEGIKASKSRQPLIPAFSID